MLFPSSLETIHYLSNKSFQLAICSLFYFWNGAIFSNENEIKILNLEMKYLSSNVNVSTVTQNAAFPLKKCVI